jgi:hypothetical protein
MPPRGDADPTSRDPRAAARSPAMLRKVLWRLRFQARVALGRGALPNALVIGASKGGTTSIYHWLAQHPRVCASRIKEVRYFNGHYANGPRWYAAQFAPGRRQTVRLEASPSYLWDPHAPARVRALLVAPKLVALLREPVDRAWSQYWMRVRRGETAASFEALLAEESARFGPAGQMPDDGAVAALDYGRQSYLGKGLYAPQIERWLPLFPRESFHFIRSEDLFEAPRRVCGALLDFLGLPSTAIPDLTRRNAGDYPPLDPALRRALEPLFAASNARVTALTGISWG